MRAGCTPSLRRRSAAVASAIAVALALGGCADDLEAFRDELRPLEDTAEEQRSEIAVRLRSLRLGSAEDARAVRHDTAELSETYDEIEALEPPDDYEEPFAAYVRANESLVRDLRRFADELAAGRAGGLRDASDAVVDALGKSQSARLRWLE